MTSDVICLGELFIDLVPHSKVKGQWLYKERYVGLSEPPAGWKEYTGLMRAGRPLLLV